MVVLLILLLLLEILDHLDALDGRHSPQETDEHVVKHVLLLETVFVPVGRFVKHTHRLREQVGGNFRIDALDNQALVLGLAQHRAMPLITFFSFSTCFSKMSGYRRLMSLINATDVALYILRAR